MNKKYCFPIAPPPTVCLPRKAGAYTFAAYAEKHLCGGHF